MQRREFIRKATGAAAAVAVPTAFGPWSAIAAPAGKRIRVIKGRVRLKSPVIRRGRTLRLDPRRNTVVEVSGNMVCHGTLEMKPRRGVTHTLRFVGANEEDFVGGGMKVLRSDVGLWVMGTGRLNIQGARKKAWSKHGRHSSWAKNDELVVTPTAPGDFATFPRLKRGAVAPPEAEILNLTRNVRIEGTPKGRAHIFIHSARPQTILYAAVRWMGPRQAKDSYTAPVLGRYGIHFHHCMNGSRGSVVRGVVARDLGSHAFVPHMSNGISFRDCISFNTFETPYWWDRGHPSNDIRYRGCVAALVKCDPPFRGTRMAGFELGAGKRNSCRECVSVGVAGGDASSTSGFVWPEGADSLWLFENCVAHNNKIAGIFTWQNSGNEHVIKGFTGRNNGRAGIEHGAYENRYHYDDCTLSGNGAGMILHAVSKPPRQWKDGGWLETTNMQFNRITFENGIRVSKRLGGQAGHPVVFTDCALPSGQIVIDHSNSPNVENYGLYDFVRMDVQGRDLEPTDFRLTSMLPNTVIRVQRKNGTAYSIDHTGIIQELAVPFA